MIPKKKLLTMLNNTLPSTPLELTTLMLLSMLLTPNGNKPIATGNSPEEFFLAPKMLLALPNKISNYL